MIVDLAGPPFDNGKKLIFSNQLRGLVEAVIKKCVDKTSWGGFATFGIQKSGFGLYPSDRGSFGGCLNSIMLSICNYI